MSALWDFASDLQLSAREGTVATALSDGTKCSLKHVGSALAKIMHAFGYEVAEIQ